MNIYRIDGIRHPAVAFGATPAEAVAQARASGEVGEREAPDARRVPLPEGYALRPARQTVELLKTAMEEDWTTLHSRLEGLTDAEFFGSRSPAVGPCTRRKMVAGWRTMKTRRPTHRRSPRWPGASSMSRRAS
jgi:hypothetical protein